MYLSNEGEPNPEGGGSPSHFVSRRKLMINPVNIKISIVIINLFGITYNSINKME